MQQISFNNKFEDQDKKSAKREKKKTKKPKP